MIKKITKLAKKGNTIVFIGPTAAGKDTLMQKISNKAKSPILISHTTRPKRIGEIHGREYFFVDDESFESIEMVEKRFYQVEVDENLWKYGLSASQGASDGLLILDWEGYIQFCQWRKDKGLKRPISVYVDIEKDTAALRQIHRGDYDENEFERRWESDKGWCRIAFLHSDYYIDGGSI